MSLSLDSVVRSYSLLRIRLQSSQPNVRSISQRCGCTTNGRCSDGFTTISTMSHYLLLDRHYELIVYVGLLLLVQISVLPSTEMVRCPTRATAPEETLPMVYIT